MRHDASSRPGRGGRRWARALLATAAALVALVAADAARAHASLTPTSATAGGTQRFTLTVPGDSISGTVVALSLRAPAGARIVSAQGPDSKWTASVDGDTVVWRGGPSEDTIFDLFTFEATLPDEEGTVSFVGRETYSVGVGPEFEVPVTVIRGSAPPPAGRPASGVGIAAVFVGGFSLLAALGSLAFVLAARRGAGRRAADVKPPTG